MTTTNMEAQFLRGLAAERPTTAAMDTIFFAEDTGVISRCDGSAWRAAFPSAVVTPSTYTQTYSTADRTVAAATAEALTDSTTGTASNTLAAGVGKYLIEIPVVLSKVSNADVLTNMPIPHKFKILSVDAYVKDPVTTAAKLTSLNVEIDTTNLTGGVVALTSANCTPLGAKVAGSAVTAANTGAADATISIEASATTAFVEGQVIVVIGIQNMDVADALASLVDEITHNAADDLDNRKSITAIIDDLQALGLAL